MKSLTRFENIDINEGFKFEGEYFRKIDNTKAVNVLRCFVVKFDLKDIVNKG